MRVGLSLSVPYLLLFADNDGRLFEMGVTREGKREEVSNGSEERDYLPTHLFKRCYCPVETYMKLV